MGIRVVLHHRTIYKYDRLVTLSPQIVRLRPAPHSRTPVTSYSLRIEPKDHFINWQQDPHSNFLARLVFPKPTRIFSLEVSLAAEMTVINPFDFFLEPYAEKYPFQYDALESVQLRQFMEPLPAGPLLDEFLASIDRREIRTNDFLVHLNQRLQREIRYMIRMEPGIQTPEQTLELASGSCRDTGWLLVQVLRRLGFAARFVSGYLIQLKPDVKPLEGPPGPSQDFTDLHAWTEVYLPGAGWIGLDPTSGLFAGEGHIPLACTPEPSSAAPITGVVDQCKSKLLHQMKVTRLYESPRVTKPYTEQQWQEIQTLGHHIDSELAGKDVRLTMGGEPTFVSIDDMDGEEWNTAAQGPTKRKLAADLIQRVKEKFAAGGLLHFGQGKWYPGESLPRWAFGLYWRKDGVPIWKNADLIAKIENPRKADVAAAQRFMEGVAERLGLDVEYVMPAFEDPAFWLQKEA